MRAMPQAMEWSLATPITRPRLACISLASAISPSPLWVLFLMARAPVRAVLALRLTLKDQRGVGATETEAVGERRVDTDIIHTLAHDIRIGDGRIEFLDIGAFADEPGLHHQERVDRFMHAGRTLAVPSERLGGADGRHSCAKHLANGVDLGYVADWCRSGVRVDVIDSSAHIFERHPHAAHR